MHLARDTASFGPKPRAALRSRVLARTKSPSCAIATPRSASAGASSRRATRFSAPSGSPVASARAAAEINESIGIPPHLSLPPVDSAGLKPSYEPVREGGIMAPNTSRTMIAALQVSLDGFTQGPNGEKDWVDSWADAIELIPDVDMFILGGHMYPTYGEYWEAIYANPDRVPPFQDRIPPKSEVAYARLAAKTRHIVLSTSLKSVSWPTVQIIRDVAEIRTLKGQPGKNTYVVGGATLVASLLNEHLIDELRLIVHPIVLGKGQALFGGVNKRLSLDLVQSKSTETGKVVVTYRTRTSSRRLAPVREPLANVAA